MKFINTTPHEIRLYGKNDDVLAIFPASNNPIRVDEVTSQIGNFPFYNDKDDTTEHISLVSKSYTAPTINFTLSHENKYICSRVVKKAIQEHFPFISHFFIVPTDVIKDTSGYVYGCHTFSI